MKEVNEHLSNESIQVQYFVVVFEIILLLVREEFGMPVFHMIE